MRFLFIMSSLLELTRRSLLSSLSLIPCNKPLTLSRTEKESHENKNGGAIDYAYNKGSRRKGAHTKWRTTTKTKIDNPDRLTG